MQKRMKLLAALSCLVLCLSGLQGCSKKKETAASENEVKQENEVQQGNESGAEPSAAASLGCYVDEQIKEPEYQENEYCTSFFIDSKGDPTIISTHYKNIPEETTEGQADEKQEENAEVQEPEKENYIYRQQDGAWNKELLTGLEQLDKELYVSDIIEYKDGFCYVIATKYTYEGEGKDQKVSEVNCSLYDFNLTTHELKDVSPEQWVDLKGLDQEKKDQWWGPENLKVNPEGKLFYYTRPTEEVHVYDPATKENKTIELAGDVYRFEVCGSKIYYNDWEKIQIYNIDTQEDEEPIKLPGRGNVSLLVTKEGDLYVAGEAGIQHWNADTSAWDIIIKGKDSLLGISNNSYVDYGVALDGEHDEFYFQMRSQENKIIHTYFDASVSNVKEHSLTIYSLVTNEVIQSAVVQYQQQHKDTDVDYIVGLADGEQDLVNDELKRVNSELLAGNGADIYVLDGLSADEFIEKGVLEDLTYLLKPLIDQGDLLDNMAKYYTDESGAIYQYPVKMSVPISMYNELVTTENPSFDELIKLTESNDKIKLAMGNMMGSVMMSTLQEHAGEWITKDKNIDIEQWKAFVNDMLSIQDYCFVYKDYKEDFKQADYSYLYCYPQDHLYGDLTGIVKGTCLRNDETLDSSMSFIRLQGIMDQFKIHYSIIDNCFVPLARIGMNKNCKNKEQAESFIQSIYSMEYQYDSDANNLPVTKSALEKFIMPDMEKLKDSSYGFGYSENESIRVDGKDVREDFMREVYNQVCNVEHPFMEDTKLLVLLANQTAKVLSGETALEEAATELSNRMSLYLAE